MSLLRIAELEAQLKRRDERISELEAAVAQPTHHYNLLIDAVDAVLSNQEHAFSGGMCAYQSGSPTWQIYEDLRIAQRNTMQQ